MTPLAVEIRAEIAAHGPMSVARYMELCLTHPTHGYYMMRDPLGARGDFITAPEVSQMFGELIGLWAAAVWKTLPLPARHDVNLVELGPGRGTLMADLLRAIKIVPDFHAAIRVHLVEVSSTLRQRQRDTLSGCGVDTQWYDDLMDVPSGPTIVLANEFFDALPVHQAVKAADGWHGRAIGIEGDRLVFVQNAELMSWQDDVPAAAMRDAPLGAVFEWREERIIRHMARRVAQRGAALVIDYGHAESGFGDTLQAVSRHSFADPLAAPGEADLTAHVDFQALHAAAAREGARVHGPIPQGEFLRRLGIVERAAKLKARATIKQASDIDAALARLTEAGPTGMGELFKVMAFAHPALEKLPGFEA